MVLIIRSRRLRVRSPAKSKIASQSVRSTPTILALRPGNFYTAPMRLQISSRVSVWIFILLSILELTALQLRADDQIIALKAARLFDGKSRTLVQNGIVIV